MVKKNIVASDNSTHVVAENMLVVHILSDIEDEKIFSP